MYILGDIFLFCAEADEMGSQYRSWTRSNEAAQGISSLEPKRAKWEAVRELTGQQAGAGRLAGGTPVWLPACLSPACLPAWPNVCLSDLEPTNGKDSQRKTLHGPTFT